MNDRREDAQGDESAGHFNEQERADERGDAAEPDAPLASEPNVGMSTILEGEPGDGVQDNLGE
jgi:hypothetical protein